MKILLLILVAFTAQAETPPPAPSCSPYCSAPMQRILEEFTQAGPLETQNFPAVFSGDCYHFSSDYNPDHTHHGFTLLEAKEGQLFMGGVFSFFAKENPYSNLTIDQAREKSPNLFNEAHQLMLTPEFAYADMNRAHPETPWRYWLKQNGESLFLLGQWGLQHQVYCRYTKNP